MPIAQYVIYPIARATTSDPLALPKHLQGKSHINFEFRTKTKKPVLISVETREDSDFLTVVIEGFISDI